MHGIPCDVQVMKISELLHALENAGEIGVTIALHSIDGSVVSRAKPCCFVLDAPKEKTLQKKASTKLGKVPNVKKWIKNIIRVYARVYVRVYVRVYMSEYICQSICQQPCRLVQSLLLGRD